MQNILVTGGTGFIGSHTATALIEKGYNIVILDNLCNSKRSVLPRLEKITGKKIKFYKCDMLNAAALKKIFAAEKIHAVIHFAGLKAVGESVSKPLEYYNNNIVSTLNLLECMRQFNVNNLVFSSSATVYGNTQTVPVTEDCKTGGTTNPYGTTKLFIEQILTDYHNANPKFNVALLRYFNPVGAHPSGLIGEDPEGIPNNLAPYILQVAAGKLSHLNIYGNDYNTPDGTGVRDYIHVMDLAAGHILALQKLASSPGRAVYNLGTGKGFSVLEMVAAFEKASGRNIPYRFAARRAGDIACLYADTQKAHNELGFKTTLTIDDMCRDSWRWQQASVRLAP